MDGTQVQDLHRRATEAAQAGDAERFETLLHDIAEEVLEHKRSVLLQRAADEIETIENMAGQAEKVGMEIREVRSMLEKAQGAMAARNYEELGRMLVDTKAALTE